ncbi:NDR1/HIN1-like protein 6 [Salvia splendens]|uniref:NDR1/HIN1-like protein 6 n=1 Tax=Salvia splendens TaxID=180675 RepID=UPI001C251544|nr:NDR1/HIN1-like protein 6 [Salvia splendens]
MEIHHQFRWCHQASPSLSLIPSPSQTPIQTLNLNPRRCCCKCLCWTVGLLTLLLFIVGATAGIIYLVFHPKLPKYSVDNLRVSDLTLNFDMTLSARFNVRITTDNPNKKIGIYYEKGSRLSVWYKDTNLCQGTTPKFYQGHQNKTVLNVALTGQNQYGKTLLNAFQEQQQTGRVPLDLNINVPVSVKLGALKLRKVRILGTCVLTVDSLTTNSLISIKASSCHFGLKL